MIIILYEDLLDYIISFLNTSDIINLEVTNREFYRITDNYYGLEKIIDRSIVYCLICDKLSLGGDMKYSIYDINSYVLHDPFLICSNKCKNIFLKRYNFEYLMICLSYKIK